MSQGTEIGTGTSGFEDADEVFPEPRTEDVPAGTGRHRAVEPADDEPADTGPAESDPAAPADTEPSRAPDRRMDVPRTGPAGTAAGPRPGPWSGGFPAAPSSGAFPAARGPMTGGFPPAYGPPSGPFAPGPHGALGRPPHPPGPYNQPSNPRMPVAYPSGSYVSGGQGTYEAPEDAGYDQDDPRPRGNGAAVTSCVLGLLGLLLSLRPLAFDWNTMADAWAAVGISVVALVLGIVGARLPARRPAAVLGMVTSLLGLLMVAIIPVL